ncbi:leucine zipper putative tumor suppressor 2 isoform X2 [Lampetra fluviatilis]
MAMLQALLLFSAESTSPTSPPPLLSDRRQGVRQPPPPRTPPAQTQTQSRAWPPPPAAPLRTSASDPSLAQSAAAASAGAGAGCGVGNMGSVSSLISGGGGGGGGGSGGPQHAGAKGLRSNAGRAPHLKQGLLQRNGLLKKGFSSKESVANLLSEERVAAAKPAVARLIKDERSAAERLGGANGLGQGEYVQLNSGSLRGGDERGAMEPADGGAGGVQVAGVPLIKDIRGPPPKIVPISGRLEKSVEKKLIRPIALKPAATTLSGGGGSGGGSSRGGGGGGGGGGGSSSQRPSQTSGPRPLKGIFPLEQVKCAVPNSIAPPSKWSSTEGLYQNVGQHAAAAGQCLLSDSGRNSLSSLPTSVGAGVAGAIGRVDGLCVVGGPGGVQHQQQHQQQQLHHHHQHIVGKISASTGHIDHIASGAPLQPPPPATMMSHHHHNGLSSGRKASAVESGMLSGGSTLDSGRGSSSSSSGGKGGGRRPTGTGGSEAGGSCDQSPCSDDPYDVEEEFRRRWTRQAGGEGGPTVPYARDDRGPGPSEAELAELRQAYGARLRQAGQKAQRAQHMAQLQVFQLTQEKRRLQEEVGRLQDEVARMQGNCQTLEKHCSAFQRQQNELAPRLEETKWEVCQKSGEISLLKQQLKEAQAELAGRLGELLAVRAQARDARSELASRDEQTRALQARLHAKTAELEVCANELQRRASEAALLREKLAQNEAQAAELRRKLADVAAAPPAGGGGGRGIDDADRRVREDEEEDDEEGEAEEAENRRGENRTDGAQPGPGKPPVGTRGLTELPPEGDDRSGSAGDGSEAESRLQGLRRDVSRMQVEVEALREKLGEQAGAFEEERRVWLEEKDKVIRYQRQLQQSYLQTFQRNRALEDEVRRMAAELESRDMEEVDAHSEFSYKNAATAGAVVSAVAPTEI